MASTSSSGVMASAKAISSSYDVFLSFRGEDTRHSFTDHLYEALNRAGIYTFRDNEEINRGEELKSEIETAIKASKASIVVLSENYALSAWCLDELVLILEQRRECNHFVLPVFYHVEPTDVRKQNKTFAIEVKTSSSRWTDENVNRWKTALRQVADLAGMVLSGSETIFLKEIVDTIYNKLDIKQVHLASNLIGMATRYEKIRKWLEQTDSYPILAICGMGGSGKTTLAKYIYDSNWKSYEIISFFEDIGSRCKRRNDLLELWKQLENDVFWGKRRKIPGVSGSMFLCQRDKRRGLIILDDITDDRQLLDLLECWDKSSKIKIIITTTKNIDNWFGGRILKYEMELLNDNEALELLSRHAFGTKVPMTGFEELVLQAVEYCEGNPLALEVLGSSLSINNTISNWESRLNLLEKDLDSRIQDVLIRSYMSLTHIYEKELFLHIACFFIGTDMDYVVKILEPDYSAKSGIKTLINRSLLSVSPNNKLIMHRLLQEMGKNIIRQESNKFPAKRSRVWLNSDSYKILSKGKGSNTIEGLALDMHQLREAKFAFKSSRLNTDALKEMDNLKLLQLNFTELDGSYENFSEDLRWLCWHGFHLRTIPSNLFMGTLVAIDMSNSKLEVFEPPTVLQSLQILNLKDSHNLLEIRNISRIPNLEILILWNCYSLNRVCKMIGDLTSLALLHMTGCKSLWKREQVNLLVASTSSGVTMAPAFSFPRSLHQLFLKDCYLECTHSNPLSFSFQPSLQYLNLGNGLFEFLPCYDHLNNLRVLDLSLCSRLKCLLSLPTTLAELYIYYCESLEKVTFQSHRFTLQEFGYEGCINLTEIEGFIKLVPLTNLDETDLGHLKWLKEYQNHKVWLVGDDELTVGRSHHVQMLYEFNIMSTSLPDIKDPKMTPFISKTPSLSFNVPPCPTNKRLKGLDVTFRYKLLNLYSCEERALFCKICTSNGVDLMYNPKVFGGGEFGKVSIWLSYWPIGNTLGVGDEVKVSISVSGFVALECGVSLVYIDDEAGKEANMGRVDILGGDFSGFQLSTGAYYLCRRDFYELIEVGRLTPVQLRNLVGYTFDYTEVRGWRKTGRPKQVNPSFTELKTVRCIIDGPELEDIYKIAEMSKSGDKTMAFASSFLEKDIKSVTKSESVDAEIEEQNTSYNPEIVVPVIQPVIEKIVVGVRSGGRNVNFLMEELSAIPHIISVHFDTKDGRLTIIGDIDPSRVVSLLNQFEEAEIISVRPAQKHEQNNSYNQENVAIKKIVLRVKFSTQIQMAIRALSALVGVISIYFDEKDEKVTIIGTINPMSVIYLLNMFGKPEIISIGPAEDHEFEAEVKPTEDHDKTMAFASSFLEKDIKSVTKSESVDAEIEEQNTSYNPEIVVPVIQPVIEKIVVGVRSGGRNVNFLMEELSAIPHIISVHFDTKDGRLTIIGDIDPSRVVSLLNQFEEAEIISVRPAQKHEQNNSYNQENVAIKKIVLRVKFSTQIQMAIRALSALVGVISIYFDEKDEKVTIIGTINPMSVIYLLNMFGKPEIISIGPAEDHEFEAEVKPTEDHDKTMAFASSFLEKDIKSVTKSESVDAEIEEQNTSYNPEIVVPVIQPVIEKIVVGVRSGGRNVNFLMEELSAIPHIISVHFDTKDGRLTIIGDIDPSRVVSLLNQFEEAEIISVRPAQKHEQNKSYNQENVAIKKIVLGVKFSTQIQMAIMALSALVGVISVYFDEKDEKVTIIGTISPMSVIYLLNMFGKPEIISIGPAEDHEYETEVKPTEEQMK